MHDIALHRSVQKQLDVGERANNVAHMFTRHHLSYPFIALAGVAILAVAWFAGADDWPARISLGLAGAAIAAIATTEYRVLAATTEGLVLLRSSRIRRRATTVMKRLPSSTPIEAVGSNLVITEYRVGKVIYSVMRRYQQEMNAIAETTKPRPKK